jgi:hypothetical protein
MIIIWFFIWGIFNFVHNKFESEKINPTKKYLLEKANGGLGSKL